MIRETRCVLLVCDQCETVLVHPDTEGVLHYATAEQARAEAAGRLCWSRDGQRDLCPVCTCVLRGHVWPGWCTTVWVASPRDEQEPGMAPFRWCTRCGALQVHGLGVIGRG